MRKDKLMHKVLVMGLAVASATGLAACSQSESPAGDTATTIEVQDESAVPMEDAADPAMDAAPADGAMPAEGADAAAGAPATADATPTSGDAGGMAAPPAE
jgi:hypothetical protein